MKMKYTPLPVPRPPSPSPPLATERCKGVDLEGHAVGAGGTGAVTASRRITGVGEERREEIRAFLRQRFTDYHKDARETVQARRVDSPFCA